MAARRFTMTATFFANLYILNLLYVSFFSPISSSLSDKIVPAEDDNLELILNVSIPLSCVFIMLCFVAFLCFKSHKELQEIKDDNLEGKPFELIQAAMILPIKRAPDLMNPNGKNLWKNAIERLKQEQIKNNPLSEPSTFLARGSLRSLVKEATLRNKSMQGSPSGNIIVRAPPSASAAADDNSSFADIVNSLIMKRRNTTFSGGVLGMPIISNPNVQNGSSSSKTNNNNLVPNIEVQSPVKHQVDGDQDERSPASSETTDGGSGRYSRDISSPSDNERRYSSSDSCRKRDSSTSYNKNKSRDGSDMVSSTDSILGFNHGNRTLDNVEANDFYSSSDDDNENDECFPTTSVPKARPTKKRSMEVVVELNTNMNRNNNRPEKGGKKEESDIRNGGRYNNENGIIGIHNRDLSKERQQERYNKDNSRLRNNRPPSLNLVDAASDGSDILTRNEFQQSLRRESNKRKDVYFPNSPEKRLPPATGFKNKATAPYRPQAADYTTVTLV